MGISLRSYSEATAAQIDKAVRELIEMAFTKATEVLRLHRTLLDDFAKLLLEKETLTADELPQLPRPPEAIVGNSVTAEKY
jgi:cell division protease FtsH